MKHSLLRLSILALVLTINTVAAFGQDFEVDGIAYSITSSSTVEVSSKSTKYKGTVVIPESVSYNETTYSVTSIGNNAFQYCSSLVSITIPNSVTSIGNFSFSGCSSLASVTIPNSVTSIGGGAFHSCSSLVSITIPNSVTSIGYYAFSGCSNLASVTIPNSVTSIGNGAFSGCSSLASVTIPNSVTSIGGGAFQYCSSLTSITIPSSVTSIEGYAFSGCSSLTSITIPSSVTSIEGYAFSGCSSLASVTIGNRVTSIGNNAFEHCSSLASITIPNSVTSIGNYAFSGCSNLASVTILCPKVGRWFSGMTSIRKVLLGDDVTSIEGYAFSGCSSLESITIPNSVTSIGNYAFVRCKLHLIKLLSSYPIPLNAPINGYVECIEVPKGSTMIYSKADFWKDIPNIYALEDGIRYFPFFIEEEGEKVVVSDDMKEGIEVSETENITLRYIGSSDCLIMHGSCDITDSIKYYGNYVAIPSIRHRDNVIHTYSYPTQVSVVNVSGTLIEQIGVNNIDNIFSLKVSGEINGTDILTIRKMKNLKLLDLEEASIVNGGTSYYKDYVTSENCIGDYFFMDKSNLIRIRLPKNVTHIKDYSFSGCSSLAFVTVPNSVTSIGDNAFGDCSSLASVTIGNSVTSIGNDAFSSCSSLASVTIPNSVTSIGSGAFSGCSSLASVTIPNSVTTIGNDAFSSCDSLASVTIGNSVTSIESGVFYGCKKLSSIHIPSNVKSIGNKAFYECYGLKSITMEEGVTSIGENAFEVNDMDSIVVPNSVKTIGAGAFKRIHYIIVGNGIEKLGQNFAIDCDSIKFHCSIGGAKKNLSVKRLIFAEGCKTIGNHAFSKCPIVSVDIGNTVESIGKDAFGECDISTLNMRQASSLKSIGDDAFYKCSVVNELYIPKSVNIIGNRAFFQRVIVPHVTFEDSENPLDIGAASFGYSYDNGRKTVVYIGRKVDISHGFDEKQIGEVIFGDKMTETGCFENFKNLSIVKLGKNIKTISSRAFYCCSSLSSINIPEGVEEIQQSSFYKCVSLTHIDLPNTVKKIGDDAFMYSHVIFTHLIIPSSVQEIGDQAFAGLSGDSIIFVSSIPPHIPHYTFANAYHSNSTIYVPRGSVGAYLHADGDPTLIDPPTVTDPDDKGRIYYYSRYIVNCRFTEYDNIEDIFSGTISPSHIDNTTINVENNNDMFDLKGIKIGSNKKPSKGIYIKNGKKVIIK